MEEVEKYNEEPVYYCKTCLSLKIKNFDELGVDFVDYCDECGCTDVGTTDIYTWEKMYKNKYGKNYIEK